jgi:hypothetical protein
MRATTADPTIHDRESSMRCTTAYAINDCMAKRDGYDNGFMNMGSTFSR